MGSGRHENMRATIKICGRQEELSLCRQAPVTRCRRVQCYMSLGGYRGRRIHGKLLPASAQQIRAIMWMYYKSQGSALIVQGSQIRGQSRHCRGSSDTFFHEAWSPRDPPRDIGFVPAKIGIQDNLCTEKAKTSFLLVLGCTPDWILPYESFFLKASLGLNFSKVFLIFGFPYTLSRSLSEIWYGLGT